MEHKNRSKEDGTSVKNLITIHWCIILYSMLFLSKNWKIVACWKAIKEVSIQVPR